MVEALAILGGYLLGSLTFGYWLVLVFRGGGVGVGVGLLFEIWIVDASTL